MRKLTGIIIHCAATHRDWMQGATISAKVAEIKRWHVQGNGWSDIGYHYIIDRSGYVASGRPLEKVGAHTKGRNTGTIGICLLGGHGSAETDRFDEHFTSMQDRALRKLIKSLQADHGKMTISGHNEFAAKACPGFTVSEWLASAPPVGSPAITSDAPNPLATIIKALFAAFGKAKS